MPRFLNDFAFPAGCFMVVAAMANVAYAASETANLDVTATVADTCSVEATALDFSTINVNAPTDEVSAGAVSITCSASKPLMSVIVGGGAHESAGLRRMSDGGSGFVPYQVYLDPARTAPLAIGDTLFSGAIPAALPQTFQVYGRVPAGTYSAGTYSDVISVTFNY